jgi:HPt (histidine-containing phosphotransfer) domain-containing protein
LLSKDYKETAVYLHTLKGVAANLGFGRMEKLCFEMMEALRSEEYPTIKHLNEMLSVEYHLIIEALQDLN